LQITPYYGNIKIARKYIYIYISTGLILKNAIVFLHFALVFGGAVSICPSDLPPAPSILDSLLKRETVVKIVQEID
jgi:hypothetical protein